MNHSNSAAKWLRMQYDMLIVIFVAVIIVVLSLTIGLIDKIYSALVEYTRMPDTLLVMTEVLIILLGLLWIAYRRWRRAYKRHMKLDNIIKSISPDALVVVSPTRNIVMCNPAIRRMFGYEPEEIMGRKTDFLYQDRRVKPDHWHEIYDVLEDDGFHLGLALGKKKDGERIFLEIITGKLDNQEGAVLLMRDITERATAEWELKQSLKDMELLTKELNASRANFQNIVRKTFDGLILLDPKGKVLLVNPVAETFLAAGAEKLIGKSFPFPVMAGEIKEVLIIRPNGKKGIGEMVGTEIEWEGKAAQLIFIRDVTELREAEHAREQLFRQFEGLLRSIASEN